MDFTGKRVLITKSTRGIYAIAPIANCDEALWDRMNDANVKSVSPHHHYQSKVFQNNNEPTTTAAFNTHGLNGLLYFYYP